MGRHYLTEVRSELLLEVDPPSLRTKAVILKRSLQAINTILWGNFEGDIEAISEIERQAFKL